MNDLEIMRVQAAREAVEARDRAAAPHHLRGSGSVSVPLSSDQLLELLWAIALAGELEATPLVLKLETALALVSDAKPPRLEIAEVEIRSAPTAEFTIDPDEEHADGE